MTPGTRTPTWKERENNKRRERRRRAIAAKIFAGLRVYGSYKLPKHCDNNEVLKALCKEAGWTVEDDGTTYKKESKPIEQMGIVGGSTSASPCSSYQPSPCASYNPSPISSSFPSPARTPYASGPYGNADADSLIPWLKNLSSGSSSSKLVHHLFIPRGSLSAPVTPPSSSPTAWTPRVKSKWDHSLMPMALGGQHNSVLPLSTPPSPGRPTLHDSGWFAGIPQSGPSSPTVTLVARNPFEFKEEALSAGRSRMWTPGQSGSCSPVLAAGADLNSDIPMSDEIATEFAFGSNTSGLVAPWEGERIHEECVPDELELTLGNSRTRSANEEGLAQN